MHPSMAAGTDTLAARHLASHRVLRNGQNGQNHCPWEAKRIGFGAADVEDAGGTMLGRG